MIGITSGLARVLLTTGFLGAVMVMPVRATDHWVWGEGSDLLGDGSSGNPYRTISVAMTFASSGDVIKVLAGDYNVNAGEAFPIIIKSGVDILGQETESESFPRIGGDVEDSGVRALFEAVANNGSLDEIRLQRLSFVGESSANLDAPHAVYVETLAVGSCSVIIDACHIARSEMNEGAEIAYSGGDGLLVDAEENEGGYVRVQTQSNLIYRNNNGLVVKADESLVGGMSFFYDTVAYNDVHGVVVDAAEDYILNWANSISYFNGTSAYYSAGGWTPADVLSGGWQTNDWEAYGTYFNPQFVNASSDDFHIGSASGCKNAGTNAPLSGYIGVLLTIDHFGGPRIREGTTDIGCDEYDA